MIVGREHKVSKYINLNSGKNEVCLEVNNFSKKNFFEGASFK